MVFEGGVLEELQIPKNLLCEQHGYFLEQHIVHQIICWVCWACSVTFVTLHINMLNAKKGAKNLISTSVPDTRGVSGQKPERAGHLTQQNKYMYM